MILYNVTTKIDRDRVQDWLKWLREVHIPALFATGLFEDYKICHLLGLNDPTDETLAVQYFFADVEKFNEYQEKHAADMQKDAQEKFGNCAANFQTVMRVFK